MKYIKTNFSKFVNENLKGEDGWVIFPEYGAGYKVDDNGRLIVRALLKDGTLDDSDGSLVCSNVDGIDEEFLRKMKDEFGDFELDTAL